MKLIIILGLLSFSISTIAEENFGVKNKIDNKIKQEVKKIFHEYATTTMQSYNKSRSNYKKGLFTKYIGDSSYNENLLPSALPKMYYKKNALLIPKINFRLDINNYFSKTFTLNGKKINLECSKDIDCFSNLLDTLTKTKTSFFSYIINDVYADETQEVNQRFRSFIQGNDTTILAALIHYNNQVSPDKIEEYDCLLFCSTSGRERFTASLFSKIDRQLDNLTRTCQSNSDLLASTLHRSYDKQNFIYGDGSRPTQLQQLIETMTGDEVLNIEDRKDFLSDYIILADVDDLDNYSFQTLSCEDLYNSANNAYEEVELTDAQEDAIENLQEQIARETESIGGLLNRGRLYAAGESERNRHREVQNRIAGLREQIEQIRNAHANQISEQRRGYCEKVSTLKECLADFYTFRNNTNVVNNNEIIKDIRVNVDNQLQRNPGVIGE